MRRRDQRGVAFPSPLVMLSVIAIAMAAIAFVATRGSEPDERRIEPVAQPSESTSPSSSPMTQDPEPKQSKPKPKPVQRAKVMVEVYNNSGITGLAGETATRAAEIGWQVTGSDNWYGTIPETTVYFPEQLKREAKQLALDLGINRRMPLVGSMRDDRLTVILTDDYR